MTIAKYIIVAAIGAFICWIFFRDCSGKSVVQTIQDSLNAERKVNDTLILMDNALVKEVVKGRTKNTEDSINYTHKIDSQSKVIAVLQGKFKVTKDSIMTLYSSLQTYYDNHDTTALFATYTDLRDQLTLANQQLFGIQISRDSLDVTYKLEVGRLNGVIDTLQVQLKQFNDLLVECTSNASLLAKNGQKVVKKAKLNALLSKVGIGVAGLLTILLIVK